jgi:RNA polymerase sigma-70 factor, ECF subfamily
VFDAEERQLLAACRLGDGDALRQLVDMHYDPLFRFLWRLTGSSDAAAELTQETFVHALERLDSFDGRSRFSTWLHAVALNIWKDTRRRAAREAGRAAEPEVEVRAAGDSEKEALARLERDEVRRAVERLPEAQRVAIMLFFYQGMSYQEIASLRGCSIGTVGSWIHHGVRALRLLLAPADTDSGTPRGAPNRTGERGDAR